MFTETKKVELLRRNNRFAWMIVLSTVTMVTIVTCIHYVVRKPATEVEQNYNEVVRADFNSLIEMVRRNR